MSYRMKKIIMTALTMMVLVAAMAFTASAAQVRATATLNVRAKASLSSAKVTTMPKGTVRKVLKTSGSWIKIKMNGKKGYVSADYVTYNVSDSGSNNTANQNNSSGSSALYSGTYFKRMGVLNWNSFRWTWYSQRVLPGGGLSIPGRHVDENGYICDKNNYIVLAADKRTLAKGTVINTPLGKKGKVYDCGCAVGTIDVYVNW